MLWAVLRTRQPGWLAEVPTGRYRLDFFCPDAILAVEVDGATHYNARAITYDRARDEWHRSQGITTLRFSGREVERSLPSVVARIEAEVRTRVAAPVPARAPEHQLRPRFGRPRARTVVKAVVVSYCVLWALSVLVSLVAR